MYRASQKVAIPSSEVAMLCGVSRVTNIRGRKLFTQRLPSFILRSDLALLAINLENCGTPLVEIIFEIISNGDCIINSESFSRKRQIMKALSHGSFLHDLVHMRLSLCCTFTCDYTLSRARY